MGQYCEASDYRIGLTPQSVVPLRLMRIAPPDQVVYRPAAVYYARSDFTRVRDGFVSTEWIWDVISISRLSQILDFLQGADWASVYIVTDKRDGTYPNPKISFGLFSAIMWKPILSGEEGLPIVRTPYAIQTVKITFVNMVEQTGYYVA